MDVKALIKHTHLLEQEITHLTEVMKENKEKIQAFFDNCMTKTITVEPADKDDITVVARKVERVYVEYNVPMLKEKLSKASYDTVTVSMYTVAPIYDVKMLMKKYGVPAKEFLKYVTVTTAVNKEAMKQMFEVGDITKEMLEGCYSVKVVKSVQIKEKPKEK